MTESFALKDNLNEDLAKGMAQNITAVYPQFNGDAFITQISPQINDLELKQRIIVFAEALHNNLPADYPTAWGILEKTLGQPLTADDKLIDGGWHYWPIAHFIEVYGLEHFAVSMQAMYEITQRFSAEFAIRPYLMRYQEQTLAILAQWAHDPNEHVRRLVSEGTRPRLPWAGRLYAFIEDPTPTLALLKELRDDPALYVRRSVANHLNDIAKDHPDWVVHTLAAWEMDKTAERQWIQKQALRSLVKQGHPGALTLLGYGDPQIKLANFQITPQTIQMGESIEFSFDLVNENGQPQNLIVDYIIHFVKANGTTAPKVFKLKTFTLNAHEATIIRKNHVIKPITTRVYYSGTHAIDIQINGRIFQGDSFDLEMA